MGEKECVGTPQLPTTQAPVSATTANATANTTCSPGCHNGWEGDSICDYVCMTEACHYDLVRNYSKAYSASWHQILDK